MKHITMAEWKKGLVFFLLLACVSLSFFPSILADPSGASISGAVTANGPIVSNGTRSDPRATITTLALNSLQQDQHWKAYVGNVTGRLTLDNPNNYTIYDWDLSSITGQVYASRYNNLTWTTVTCASQGLIVNESTFHNMTSSSSDRINTTFNWTIHKQFNVGANTIAQNTCNSTVTYVNDTRPVPTISSKFQEILVEDANGYLVYLTGIDDNSLGYDNSSTSNLVDFQMIVAESDVKGSPTPYYFYVELR
jgi:hypothetical protein